MRKILLVSAFLTAVVAACNGGGPADLTDREISDGELVAMVLPQEDLGPAYADFTLDEDESGFQSNEDVIDEAWDEEDEAEDIEVFGRVTEYDEGYWSARQFLEGTGAFTIATGVALHEDVDGASGYLKDELEDWQRAIGTGSEGATLEDADEFDAKGIGEESAGLVVTVSMSGGQGPTAYGTQVGFRRGRLLGFALIGRFDDEDVREEAAALARKLDERIVAALQGEVEPRPTPTTEPTPAPSAGIAPSDVLESFRYSSEMSVETDGGLVLTVEGEFEAPDRLRCTISGSLGGLAIGRDELVVIGDDAWIDEGEGFRATSADDSDIVDDLDLCPGSAIFWADLDFLQDLGPLGGQPDTINGVAAARYPLGEMAEALGSIGLVPPGLEGMTINAFDVWVAEDGGWPVALSLDISADAEAAAEAFGFPPGEAGEQARIAMRVDITEANSADIHVEPPAQ